MPIERTLRLFSESVFACSFPDLIVTRREVDLVVTELDELLQAVVAGIARHRHLKRSSSMAKLAGMAPTWLPMRNSSVPNCIRMRSGC